MADTRDFPKNCLVGASRESLQVEEELSSTRLELDRLDDRLNRLGDKLISVLRCEGALIAGNVQCPPENGLVPLAEAIRFNRKRIEEAVCRVDSWINRIELS